MTSRAHLVLASTALLLATACSVERAGEGATTSSVDALSDSKVTLPAGDPCRDVLAPLARGLADGALGLAYTRNVTVSATSETDTRLYTVAFDGPYGAARYEVELDNDSASLCLLLSAKPALDATLGTDARTRMTRAERDVAAPVTLTPADDDCASTVKLLAAAAGVSAVGERALVGVAASFEGEDENRYYGVHVDGRSFVVEGQTFANDYDFALETSNDSASKCWVQDFRRGGR